LAPYELVLVPLAEGVGPSQSVSFERLGAAIEAASLELGSARDWLIAGSLPAGDLAGALRTTHPTMVAPNAAAVAPRVGLVHWRGSCSCVDGLFVPVGSVWLSNDDRRCGVAGQRLPQNVQGLPGQPLVALRLSLADEEIAVASDSEFIAQPTPKATESSSAVSEGVH
jgi:hypothetical protein